MLSGKDNNCATFHTFTVYSRASVTVWPSLAFNTPLLQYLDYNIYVSFPDASILSPCCYYNCIIQSIENTPRAKDTSCRACKKVTANTAQEYTGLSDYIILHGNHENAKVFHEGVLLHSRGSKQQPFHSFLFYDQ